MCTYILQESYLLEYSLYSLYSILYKAVPFLAFVSQNFGITEILIMGDKILMNS